MKSHDPDIRLQELLERHATGAPLETLLAELRGEPGDTALAADLTLSLALAQHLPATLRPARRAAMQAELQAAFQAERRVRGLAGWLSPARRKLVLRLGGAALACSLALGGGVVASAESIPGDALYPVKRAVESARLAFTWSPEARARVWLDLSDSRHKEIRNLDLQGRQAPASLMDAWLTAHRQARQEALQSGDPQLMQLVEQRVKAHSQDLEASPQSTAPQVIHQLAEEPTATAAHPAPDTLYQEATASPTSVPATATQALQSSGRGPGRGDPGRRGPGNGSGTPRPRPSLEPGQTPWPPQSPRDRWRTATVPPATIEAWATERAQRQTEEPPRPGGPGEPRATRDPSRRATDEARWATEQARRATERAAGQRPQETPVPPTIAPVSTPRSTPIIGPTFGPPPGPPPPSPDPRRTPEGGRRCPPRCFPPPRPSAPPVPTIEDPPGQPLPTSLNGAQPSATLPPPPTPEQVLLP